MSRSRHGVRVLAIDPTSQGFGYGILEAGSLIDWGVRSVPGNRNEESVRLISLLIDRYQVDALAVEDHTARGSRRAPRVRALLAALGELGNKHKLRVARVSPGRRLAAFKPLGAKTKYAIAQALAIRFPELAARLPPIRKPWMSEDYRMGIFDAVALAVAAAEWRTIRSDTPRMT